MIEHSLNKQIEKLPGDRRHGISNAAGQLQALSTYLHPPKCDSDWPAYYHGTAQAHVGQAFQPDLSVPSGWKA
jgi:hypothetical protein